MTHSRLAELYNEIAALEAAQSTHGVRFPPVVDSFYGQHGLHNASRLRQRFVNRIQVGSAPKHMPDLGPCWTVTWAPRTHANDYRGVKFGSKTYNAHKLAYLMWRGPIAGNLSVDHMCRRPACVRPDHLRLTTPAENTRADHGVGDLPGSRTKCRKAGHPFDEANTYIEPKTGWRQCRACKQANSKRYSSPEYKAAKAAGAGADVVPVLELVAAA